MSENPRSYPAELPHGIMFHHFHDERHTKGQGSISREEFEEILRFVGRERILEPAEWLRRVDACSLQPQDLSLTFDDALLSQIDIALPVLDQLGLKAFWFVYSSVFEGRLEKFEIYRAFRCRFFGDVEEFFELFVRRVLASKFATRARKALDENEIKRRLSMFPFYTRGDVEFRLIRDRALTRSEYEGLMDAWIAESGVSKQELAAGLWMADEHLTELAWRGHTVGLHSYSHPMVMADLPPDEQRREYEQNLRHIRRVCGSEPVSMGHPANSYDYQTLCILSSLGIRCGFRSNMSPSEPGERPNRSRLELARQDHANIMGALRQGENG